MRSKNKSTSRAVERALAIVEAFGERDRMSCRDIARRLRIPKTSAWYILRTLESQGYVLRDAEDGRYRLSMKMATFGHSLTEKRIKRLAIPVLMWLTEQTHLSTGLASSGWILHCALPDMRPENWKISQNEFYPSPCGKLSLAYRAEPEVLAKLEQQQLMRRMPIKITNLSHLMEELAQVRQQGYAVDYGRTIHGLCFVSAPVFGPCGHLKGCIGVAGFVGHIREDRLPQIGASVKEAAQVLMQQLNYPDQLSAEGAGFLPAMSRRCLPGVGRIFELPVVHYDHQV
ncbi:MAG: IclR family transcriptional regulator [Acidobacteriia bacterium]|nr:IclR family transcriptional regulator [Terriglobia bacterium]